MGSVPAVPKEQVDARVAHGAPRGEMVDLIEKAAPFYSPAMVICAG